MGSIITENIINIFFGATALITSLIALHYKRLEHRQQVEQIIDEGRRAGLFLSREAMMTYLVAMYSHADEGDVIWAQCIRCTYFTPDVRKQILSAAGKGVKFKMLINQHSPALNDFQSLFIPLQTAEISASTENAMSLQGLSDKEVVLAFPGVDSYTAVLVRDPYFVQIIRSWFDERFAESAPLTEKGPTS